MALARNYFVPDLLKNEDAGETGGPVSRFVNLAICVHLPFHMKQFLVLLRCKIQAPNCN